MKYTIEIDTDKVFTDGQNNKLYRAKGFNSLVFDKNGLDKLEPVEKAWDSELEKHRREAYDKGYADGKADATDTDMIGELKQVEYIRGYNTAIDDYNTMFEFIFHNMKDFRQFLLNAGYYNTEMVIRSSTANVLYDLIISFDMAEVMSEFKKWQEEKKKAEEIEVGDEVLTPSGNRAIATAIEDDSAGIIFDDGSCGVFNMNDFRKTGRHFDEVEQLLDKLRGENE